MFELFSFNRETFYIKRCMKLQTEFNRNNNFKKNVELSKLHHHVCPKLLIIVWFTSIDCLNYRHLKEGVSNDIEGITIILKRCVVVSGNVYILIV